MQMDDILKQAREIENLIKRYFDLPGDPLALDFKKQLQSLIYDLEVKKDPRTVEDLVHHMVMLLESMHDDQVMDFGDRDDLKKRLESMRHELRELE